MGLRLDPQAEAARDLAKRAVPAGGTLGIDVLLAALYHGSELRNELPQLAAALKEPPRHHQETPARVPVSEPLKAVLTDIAARTDQPLGPRDWFRDLLASRPGRAAVTAAGLPEPTLREALKTLGVPEAELEAAAEEESRSGAAAAAGSAATSWRASPERAQALHDLAQFGRMLTDGAPVPQVFVEQEPALRSLVRVLVKRKARNAIVIGHPGTGKTAVVHELARRLLAGHESLPERLRDCDIFELSPSFLRAGASMVGEYDRRVKQLLNVLRGHPRVILFVDEVHSLLQSGMHERGPFTDANESFKRALSSGEISLIGCTTLAEYRHYIEVDEALAQRFSVVRIDPPSPQAALAILEARLPLLSAFYGLSVPAALLEKAVELTERHLPGRAQPRKSIQLLDEACAFRVAGQPGATALREEDLWAALEETVGHSVVRQGDLSADGLYDLLREKIIGQDAVLNELSRAVVAGLGSLAAGRSGPRGVFLLGGPTGVGKTQTALRLAEVLGGGREALIRINCNLLHASAHDSGPALNILLGVPPGYLGYVRGKGGELSKIRDHPQCVVLFDEIEKASLAIGDLLLQIIDEGRCEDADGNRLDFRRAFIVFTTNAGSLQVRPRIGFAQGFEAAGNAGEQAAGSPAAGDARAVKAAMRSLGFHDAFLGRIESFFIFASLSAEAVRRILEIGLERLGRAAAASGYRLDSDPAALGRLAGHWQPQFGARHLVALVDLIAREIGVAEAAGELAGVAGLRLEAAPGDDAAAPGAVTAAGAAAPADLRLTRQRRGDILTVLVH